MLDKVATIGVVGAGRLGTAIARQSISVGYDVRISNSRGPESLVLMLDVLLPGVLGSTVEETIRQSDIVILAIPLNQYRTVKPAWLKGKIVIDAMNYWPPTEGEIPEFMNKSVSSSMYLQSYFSQATIIKTLNHVAYNEIEQHSLPSSIKDRRAIAIAGDDQSAKRSVEQFISTLGFEPVDLGSLSQGILFEPDTKLFNARLTKGEMQQILGE